MAESNLVGHRSGDLGVSIPSQAGILLAAERLGTPGASKQEVSIPSQAGILLAAESCLEVTSGNSRGLNTLTGGHPLGGKPEHSGNGGSTVCLNTLTGGHPLGGPQKNHRRITCHGLNTLTGGHPLGGRLIPPGSTSRSFVSIPSQAGILLAGSIGRAPD